MPLYSETIRRKVVKRACEAVAARIEGRATFTAGTGAARQTFKLNEAGYCNRFVRQCFETALGLPPFSWRFGAATARETIQKLAPYEVPATEPLREGDILGCAGDPGHIAIYVGTAFDSNKKLVAENTVSTRGYPAAPGTKVSRLEAFLGAHGGRKKVRVFRLFA